MYQFWKCKRYSKSGNNNLWHSVFTGQPMRVPTGTGFNNPPFGNNYGDPSSAIGTNGNFYEGYITLAGGMGVATSTNNGANWTTLWLVP